MKNETFEKQLDLLTKSFELMKVKNGELKEHLAKLKTETTTTTENIKTEVKQLAVSWMVKTSEISVLSTDFQENIVGATTYASSCREYFKQGDRTNGSYTIRPDVELHSFEVICEFTENSGYTIIKPENWPKNGFTFPEKSESRCTGPNCYQKKIEYGASKDQIKVSYHVIHKILLIIFKAFKALRL